MNAANPIFLNPSPMPEQPFGYGYEILSTIELVLIYQSQVILLLIGLRITNQVSMVSNLGE